jgi:hypothetical protein
MSALLFWTIERASTSNLDEDQLGLVIAIQCGEDAHFHFVQSEREQFTCPGDVKDDEKRQGAMRKPANASDSTIKRSANEQSETIVLGLDDQMRRRSRTT